MFSWWITQDGTKRRLLAVDVTVQSFQRVTKLWVHRHSRDQYKIVALTGCIASKYMYPRIVTEEEASINMPLQISSSRCGLLFIPWAEIRAGPGNPTRPEWRESKTQTPRKAPTFMLLSFRRYYKRNPHLILSASLSTYTFVNPNTWQQSAAFLPLGYVSSTAGKTKGTLITVGF